MVKIHFEHLEFVRFTTESSWNSWDLPRRAPEVWTGPPRTWLSQRDQEGWKQGAGSGAWRTPESEERNVTVISSLISAITWEISQDLTDIDRVILRRCTFIVDQAFLLKLPVLGPQEDRYVSYDTRSAVKNAWYELIIGQHLTWRYSILIIQGSLLNRQR